MDVNRLKLMADRLIAENGNEAILVENIKLPYDSTLGDYPLVAVDNETKISIQSLGTNEIIDGVTNMLDIKALVSGSIPVNKNWTVKYSGGTYRIIHIKKTTAQDINAMNTIYLRK